MKKTVVVYEGASASSKKEDETLSSVVKRKFDANKFDFFEYDSLKKSDKHMCQDTIISSLLRKKPLILIGKSLGAVTLHHILSLIPTYSPESEVSILYVDPHSPFWTKAFKGIPVANKFRPLPQLPFYANVKNGIFFNVYQQNHWPNGAVVSATQFVNIKISNESVRHSNIIYSDTVAAILDRFNREG